VNSLNPLEFVLGLFIVHGERVLPIYCVDDDQFTLRIKDLYEGSLNDLPVSPPVNNHGWLLRNLQLEYKNGTTNRCAIIPLGILLVNGLQSVWIVVMDEHYDLLALRPSAIDGDDDVYDIYAKDSDDTTNQFPATDQKESTMFDTNPLQHIFRLGPVSVLIDALYNLKQLISP
jgi:hypothetical protein